MVVLGRSGIVIGRSGKSSFDTCLCCSFCATESGNGVDSKVPVFCRLFIFCDSKGLNSHSRLQAVVVEAFAFAKIFFSGVFPEFKEIAKLSLTSPTQSSTFYELF